MLGCISTRLSGCGCVHMSVHARTHACAAPQPPLCLPHTACWTGDYPHFVPGLCRFSVSQRAAECASLDSFVWMSSDVRTAAASGQSRAQPAEPGLSALVHWQRGMKRVREWQRPVIWWLSNGERASARASVTEMRLSGMNRLYHWLQQTPCTQQQHHWYLQPLWLLIKRFLIWMITVAPPFFGTTPCTLTKCFKT